MFTGVKLNADPESEVGVIVSARRLRTRYLTYIGHRESCFSRHAMSGPWARSFLIGTLYLYQYHLNDNGFLHGIHSFGTNLRPVGFTGDIIALDDDASKTMTLQLED